MQTILTNTTAAARTVNVRREGEADVQPLVLMPGQPTAFQGEPVETPMYRAAVESGAITAQTDAADDAPVNPDDKPKGRGKASDEK